jgi:hypothetical protein
MKKCIILVSILIFISLCVNSQTLKVFEEWTTSNGTQNMFLETFTKTDANRNVYVGGATINSSGDYDILLTKYDSRGTLMWTEQYAGAGYGDDAAAAICFGDSGNVYLTGTVYASASNQNDCVVLKYDQYGNLKWARTYNGTANGPDFGTDICIDANDNVYIGGSCTQTSTYYDFLVLKYDRGGVYQWVSFYNNLNLFDIANKIDLNGSTVVVAGGTQVNATKWEYAVANFNASNGNFGGVRTTTSTGTGIDQINDLCVDASGNLYVTGGVVNTNTGYDYQTIKLNDSLDVQWTATYNHTDSLDDMARSVQVDANGNVYVTGYSLTQDEDTNLVTIKYNSSGTEQWVEEFNDDDDGCDKGEALVVDDSGNIIVAATYFNGSNSDYLTLKYNDDGDLQWKITYNGLYNQNDQAMDICLDDDGDIIVVGQSEVGDEFQYITVKYSEIDVIVPPDDEAVSSLSYLENRGQLIDTDQDPVPDIRFYAKDACPVHYFWDDKISYMLTDSNETTGMQDYSRVDMEFIESSSDLKVRAFDEIGYYSNFYLGHISEGRARLKNFSRALYYEMYDDIDLQFSSNNVGPKLYFIIKPGGSPADIHCRFSGADSVNVGSNDELILHTGLGNIVYPQAKAYQIDANGDTINLAWQPEYDLDGSHLYFTTSTYNTSLDLVIELKNGNATTGSLAIDNLEWCSYYGGSAKDVINDIHIDEKDYPDHKVHYTGTTESDDLPVVPGNTSVYAGLKDAFIVSTDGHSNRFFESYYGGVTGDENSNCIVVDKGTGDIYIAGLTNSDDLPTPQPPGAYCDPWQDGQDIFIARFDGEGILDWGTYYGGPTASAFHDEIAYDIDISYFINSPLVMNFLYVVGKGTETTPLLNSLYPTNNTYQGLILKFNSSLAPVWASVYPVRDIRGVAVDPISASATTNACNVYITGGTRSVLSFTAISNDESHPSTSQNSGGSDAFVSGFDGSDNEILAEYIGGSGSETGMSICHEKQDIIICGTTTSSNFLIEPSTVGYNQSTMTVSQGTTTPSNDAFITRIDRDGTLGVIQWSTYFGGGHRDWGMSIDCDYEGNFALYGTTQSGTMSNSTKIPFPSSNPSWAYVQSDKLGTSANPASTDTYVALFNEENILIWTSYFGCDPSSYGNACKISKNKQLYIAGETSWNNNYTANDEELPNVSDPLGNAQIELFYHPGTFQLNNPPSSYNTSDAFAARFNIDYSIVGMEEKPSNSINITCYPNPASCTINVSLPDGDNIKKIIVYDILGKELLAKDYPYESNKAIINVSGLKPGIYYMDIEDKYGRVLSNKFVKL